MQNLLVPTDFTRVAGQAVNQAAAIARKTGGRITLCHIADSPGADPDLSARLQGEAEVVRQKHGIPCEWILESGETARILPRLAHPSESGMVVIGTPPRTGGKPFLLGTDLLRLLPTLAIPALLVQEGARLSEAFRKIVLPVGAHPSYLQEICSLTGFARIFGSEVHLYSLKKREHEWPMPMLENIEKVRRILEEEEINMVRIREEQATPVTGLARETLRYAAESGAELLWMMPQVPGDYHDLGRGYQEMLIWNELRIPVLFPGHAGQGGDSPPL